MDIMDHKCQYRLQSMTNNIINSTAFALVQFLCPDQPLGFTDLFEFLCFIT